MRDLDASPKFATDSWDHLQRSKTWYAMVLEYRKETKLRDRILLALTVPFVALVGSVMVSFSGVFSREAYDLLGAIFEGDMSRLGDFLGYILALTLSVGISCALMIAGLFAAFFLPDHIVEIDADRRMVEVRILPCLPWLKSSRSFYRFDEIEAVELKYDDEQNEILLRLPDRKRALTLVYEFRRWAAEQKFRRLKELGLPTK